MRFFWSWPLVALLFVLVCLTDADFKPVFSGRFWLLTLLATCAQAAANLHLLRVATSRNLMLAAGFVSLRAPFAALYGIAFASLGWFSNARALSWLEWTAVLLAVGAVWVAAAGKRAPVARSTLINGLACGLYLAISGLLVREASLALGMESSLQAALTILFLMVSLHTLALGTIVALREPEALNAVRKGWQTGLIVGGTSALGTLAHYFALTLAIAPLVMTAIQTEILFSALFGWWLFKERPSTREIAGVFGLAAALVVLVAA